MYRNVILITLFGMTALSAYDKLNECIIALCKHPQKKSVALFTECYQQWEQKDWKMKENPAFLKLMESLYSWPQLPDTTQHYTTFLPESMSWHKQCNNDHLAVWLKS